MLESIKNLMRMQQEVDALKSKLDLHSQSVETFTKEMGAIHAELTTLRQTQQEMLKELEANLGKFSQIKEDMSKEVYDFKLLKSQLQKRLLDKFEEELKQELKVNVASLRKDLSDYEDMKASMKELLKRTEMTKQEMGKWMEISKSIKQSDFELGKFANQLRHADAEKLELMRKIDTLERLVSKMRRGMPQQMRQ
jgi:chromosome segregation ATPase